MEHFDLMSPGPEIESLFWQKADQIVLGIITFLFAGKAYAIFSLLFGLSFFMQMESEAGKGNDFRLRFIWRLTILLALGYLNGLIYMGEFFVVYAFLGIVLIPLYKVPTKYLVAACIILFLQIPAIISFISFINGSTPNETTPLVAYMDSLYVEAAEVFTKGSFADVIAYNSWKGQFSKLLWVFTAARYPQLIGLFIAGILIGRSGIYKSEERMVKYSRKVLPYSIGVFTLFYAIVYLLPVIGIEGYALRAGTTLFKSYGNLGMMMMYVTGLTLLYYQTKSRYLLDRLAPVGRMSVTNYMAQSLIGVPLFYGFGANLAIEFTFLQCLGVGLVIYVIQIEYSNWWMKRFYYGPVEWLWRVLTWFRPVPLKRQN
ncbi:MAG: DUF418 domain-containing protein [Tannerellaceae bacterium]|nr:DUF418 domain-containing protein [Tannerellaceae bacterium]